MSIKPIDFVSILTAGLSLFLLASCQIYRNNSRELFEKNAPSKIVNSDIGSKSIRIIECWTQDQMENTPALPVEEFQNQYFYTQQANNDGQTLEVCIAENIPDSDIILHE